jgi:hypothetical protein
MPDETLTAALHAVRVRVPDSLEDAARLRAEIRSADAALGAALRAATSERLARLDRDADGGER